MYYFDKAGYELMEQDDSIIGVGLEFYCKALNVAVILSRPFHETIHGHRIENAKNDLDRKSTRLNSSHNVASRMPSSA